MPDKLKIFTFLFIMLGPFKILGPFERMTRRADVTLTRQIAFRSILFSCLALLVAGFLGETILDNFGIPLPILALTGGIILFLVALQNMLQQFIPSQQMEIANPSLEMAIHPLAFPTIVTPYGVATVIVFLALTPDLDDKLLIGAMLLGIMALNLLMMYVVKVVLFFNGAFLHILGAVLGVVQAALGLQIINSAFKLL